MTGGYVSYPRDEVSGEFINQARPLYVQVLQYDFFSWQRTAGAWSEIGRMQKARYHHAVVEVDGALFCPVGPTNKSPLSTPQSPLLLTITISSSFYPYPMFYPIGYHCSNTIGCILILKSAVNIWGCQIDKISLDYWINGIKICEYLDKRSS